MSTEIFESGQNSVKKLAKKRKGKHSREMKQHTQRLQDLKLNRAQSSSSSSSFYFFKRAQSSNRTPASHEKGFRFFIFIPVLTTDQKMF